MSLEMVSEMKLAEYMTFGKVVFTPSAVRLSNSDARSIWRAGVVR